MNFRSIDERSPEIHSWISGRFWWKRGWGRGPSAKLALMHLVALILHCQTQTHSGHAGYAWGLAYYLKIDGCWIDAVWVWMRREHRQALNTSPVTVTSFELLSLKWLPVTAVTVWKACVTGPFQEQGNRLGLEQRIEAIRYKKRALQRTWWLG